MLLSRQDPQESLGLLGLSALAFENDKRDISSEGPVSSSRRKPLLGPPTRTYCETLWGSSFVP